MLDPAALISKRARGIDASGIRRVFDLAAKLTRPINLSIGQPDFDVPDEIKRAAITAIEGGRNRYTVTQGQQELRDAVRSRFDSAYRNGGRWDHYGTLVTSGVSGGLVLALMACVEDGQEVVAPDPYFVMYKHLTRLVGGRPVFADTYPDFRLTAARLEPLLTDRTRLVIVSSPSNPTGVVLGERDWADLVDLCERRGVLLVSDEIYDEFCYERGPDDRCPSPASLTDRILVLKGFSKTYAMTGWRLGYAMGPTEIIEQMTKLQQYTFVCAPSMAQWAGAAALDVDMSAHVAAYRRKRDRLVEKLSPHFDLTTPGGAFYAFPRAPGNLTGAAFCERAVERNVLVIPGNVFSERDTHFRISYACNDAMLDEGLDILVDLTRRHA